MGYWGWRPLVLGVFISTWVVGCNIVTDYTSPSAAPSNYPDVTLTVGRLPTARVSAAPTRAAPTRQITLEPSTPSPTPAIYVVQPGDTLAAIAEQFGVTAAALISENGDLASLTPGQTVRIPASSLIPLSVFAPTCTETRPGSLLCLGRIDNPLDFPVESVAVEVRLLEQDGSVMLSERSTIAQTSIPSGGFAPYQAIFQANWGDFTSADARLISAVRGEQDRIVVLRVEDVDGQALDDSRMLVTATLYNPGAQPAELQRAFVTLTSEDGSVTGYRVIRFEAGMILDGGSRMPLRVELTPQTAAPNPTVTLYVEARLVEE